MIPGFSYRRRFSDLSEKEILALAISSEEDDSCFVIPFLSNFSKMEFGAAGYASFIIIPLFKLSII